MKKTKGTTARLLAVFMALVMCLSIVTVAAPVAGAGDASPVGGSLADLIESAVENGIAEIDLGDGVYCVDSAITIEDGVEITVTGGTITRVESLYAIFVVKAGGNLTLNNVVLSAEERGESRSVSPVDVYGQLTLNDSIITGFAAPRGGGLFIESTGSVTMNGGKITGNKATGSSSYEVYGGGVCIDRGSFTLNDGEISYNAADDSILNYYRYAYGGGIFMRGGSFTMTNGRIVGNTAYGEKPSFGGGICIFAAGTIDPVVTLISGEISDNKVSAWADAVGGGIYVDNDIPLQLDDAAIYNNSASENGSGVWFCEDGEGYFYSTSGGFISSNIEGANRGTDFFSLYPWWIAYFGEKSVHLQTRLYDGTPVKWFSDDSLDPDSRGKEIENINEWLTANVNIIDVALKSETEGSPADGHYKLIISGNSAKNGGGIATNGPLFMGDPSDTSLTVRKDWTDSADKDHSADEITVTLVCNGDECRFEGAEVKLNAGNNWTHTWNDLPSNYTWTVKEKDVPGYNADYSGIVDGVITITNSPDEPEPTTGSLTIRKSVYGGGTEAANKEFTFTITGPEGYYRTVTIRGNGYETLTDLVPGVYTVTEASADMEGYVLSVSGEGSYTVTAGDTTTAYITNTYDPEPEPEFGNLTIRKTVDGGDAEAESKEFTFTVTGPEGYERTVTITGRGSVTLTDLVPGDYTVTEANADIEGYTLTVSGEGSYTVTAGEITYADITNTYEPEPEPETGDLTVSKTVTGDGDTEKEFTFTVTLSDTDINGVYGDMTFTNGVAVFTLKHGESATAVGLPAGVTYTVSESDNEGYEVSATGESGTITADGTAAAEFVNHMEEEPEEPKTGSLTVSKTVSGDAADTDRYFTFTVTLSEPLNGTYGHMHFVDGVSVFHLKHGESVTATDLPAGIGYTVTEAEANRNGYTTTETDTSGTIEGDAQIEANFNNHKDNPPPEPEFGNLTVTKTVSGNATNTVTSFHFTVTLSEPITGDYGDMDFVNGVATFTLKHGESATATGLPAGITYTVTEAEANQDGYITTETGASGVIPEAGTAQAAFLNYRNVTLEEPKTGPLLVRKLVTGEGGELEREFTFVVTLSGTYTDENGVEHDASEINGTYGDLTFVNGVATFTLKSGEAKWGRDIPVGIGYIVEELEANLDGYDTVAQGATGTIQEDVRSEVRFRNHKGLWEPDEDDPWEDMEDPEIPLSDFPFDEIPQTGDNSRMALWFTIAALSVVGVTLTALQVTIINKRRRRLQK